MNWNFSVQCQKKKYGRALYSTLILIVIISSNNTNIILIYLNEGVAQQVSWCMPISKNFAECII